MVKKKKKWIQGAIKKPGSLTAAAKRAGMSIDEYCAQKNIRTKTKRRCNLRKNLISLPKRGRKSKKK